MVPDARYAKTPDGGYIAYKALGGGPPDIAVVGSIATNIEVFSSSVLAAVASTRATIVAAADGGMVAALLAATQPERVAESSEVLVSSTVKDLVAGSGLGFEDRGAHTLKGVPSE